VVLNGSGYSVERFKLYLLYHTTRQVERFFEELRAKTSNKVFADKQQVEDCIENLIREYNHQPQLISNLTLFPYLSAIPN